MTSQEHDLMLANKNDDNNTPARDRDEDDDDDDEDGNGGENKVNVNAYRFAEDDVTTEVPHPQRCVLVLPKTLEKLVDTASIAEAVKNNINNNSSNSVNFGTAENPIRVFTAPHPRHGEAVMFLGATFAHQDKETGELSLDAGSSNNNDDDIAATAVASLRIFELQSRKPPYSCWFLGDFVEPSSPLFVATPMHPAFFALRLAALDAASNMGRDAFEQAIAAVAGKGEENNDNNEKQQSNFKFRASDDWTLLANNMIFLSKAPGHQTGDASSSSASASSSSLMFPNLWEAYLRQGFEAICESKQVDGSPATFYRFAPAKARDWLQERFSRLVRCAAFDRLTFGAKKQQQQQQQNEVSGLLEERAMCLLLENVATVLPHMEMRRWVMGSKRAATNAAIARPPPMTPAAAGGAGALEDDLLFGGAAGGAGGGQKGKAEPPAQSASVKRLAKQGPPKGTPSISSFFGAKKK